MPHATINLPTAALEHVLYWAEDLESFALHDSLVIDCGDGRFFSPFAMLLTGTKIKLFRQRNPKVRIEFRNFEKHEYLAHMGFFHLCGLDYGREVGEAVGGENYLPITCIARDQFYEADSDKYSEIQDLIQRHVDRLALVLVRDKTDNPVLFDVLSFGVREMMRNVFEHSQSQSLHYCAQYWPKSKKVEFAITDFGVGIRRALAENPNFRYPSDKEAIECSLWPSVSGKTHLPPTSQTWGNSGYGLFMTSSLARCGGNFVIVSGSKAIHLTRKNKYNYDTAFPGTAIRMNFAADEIGDVQARLSEFRIEAQRLSKLAGGSARPPSAMSLLLRKPLIRR
ncbi:hypothetical protein [Pararhizobium sp.]|uniref:hypothetical protein n=1 Tax=Pararhizobium sp. TaxID=1977563 RepID=UPI003D138E97